MKSITASTSISYATFSLSPPTPPPLPTTLNWNRLSSLYDPPQWRMGSLDRSGLSTLSDGMSPPLEDVNVPGKEQVEKPHDLGCQGHCELSKVKYVETVAWPGELEMGVEGGQVGEYIAIQSLLPQVALQPPMLILMVYICVSGCKSYFS